MGGRVHIRTFNRNPSLDTSTSCFPIMPYSPSLLLYTYTILSVTSPLPAAPPSVVKGLLLFQTPPLLSCCLSAWNYLLEHMSDITTLPFPNPSSNTKSFNPTPSICPLSLILYKWNRSILFPCLFPSLPPFPFLPDA